MAHDFGLKIAQLVERNRLLIDHIFDAIWVIDVASMTFDYITPSIEPISGYGPDAYIGKPFNGRMSKHFYQEVMTAINDLLIEWNRGNKPTRSLELEMAHKKGGIYWVEVTAKLIVGENEKLKVVGVTRDITKRKQFEFSQEDLIARLNETLAEKQRLLEENKVLRDFLPICSGCKRIRDESDHWWPLDYYIDRHTDTHITHTICPDCKAIFDT